MSRSLVKKMGVTLLFLGGISSAMAASPWAKIQEQIAGKVSSIGSYSNGCIIGAEALPLKGPGYQVTRAYKHRFYGNSILVDYIEFLAKRAHKVGLPPLLIGDMAMPAGGRFDGGHVSHQSGLDVDINLNFGPATKAELRNPKPDYMVSHKLQEKNVNSNWTNKQATLIRLAAQDPKVNRIFVNPAIKVELCKTVKGDRRWLRKIRPWFAHRAHIHVRLSCPKNSKHCIAQAPIPRGEGCGAILYSWFEPAPPILKKHVARPKKVLPELCQMVLSQANIGK